MSVDSAGSAVSSSRQLLVVMADDWDSRVGQLQRYGRAAPGDPWHAVGAARPVSLGRAGLAWGRGRHPPPPGGARLKREGDGRAPGGIFAISALFGDALPDSAFARALRLPYRHNTADLKCIDDPASAHYNRIVDQAAVARPDWASGEDMRRSDRRYVLGAVVDHNCDPPLAGAGSCIFLHVWSGEGLPTAGCTAMALADMECLAGWLDGAAAPLLVQLPRAEYEARRASWGLPRAVAGGRHDSRAAAG